MLLCPKRPQRPPRHEWLGESPPGAPYPMAFCRAVGLSPESTPRPCRLDQNGSAKLIPQSWRCQLASTRGRAALQASSPPRHLWSEGGPASGRPHPTLGSSALKETRPPPVPPPSRSPPTSAPRPLCDSETTLLLSFGAVFPRILRRTELRPRTSLD